MTILKFFVIKNFGKFKFFFKVFSQFFIGKEIIRKLFFFNLTVKFKELFHHWLCIIYGTISDVLNNLESKCFGHLYNNNHFIDWTIFAHNERIQESSLIEFKRHVQWGDFNRENHSYQCKCFSESCFCANDTEYFGSWLWFLWF